MSDEPALDLDLLRRVFIGDSGAYEQARAILVAEPPALALNDDNGPWCGCGQRLGHAVPNVDCDPKPAEPPALDGLARKAREVIGGHTERDGLCRECNMTWPCHAWLLADDIARLAAEPPARWQDMTPEQWDRNKPAEPPALDDPYYPEAAEYSRAAEPPALDVERLAVIGAARIFLAAHDRVIGSDIVTRDDTFAMSNAADDLRDVLREYDAEYARLAREGSNG